MPLLTVAIFTALGIGAAVTRMPLPLVITIAVFAVTFARVRTVVPRTARDRGGAPQGNGQAASAASRCHRR